MKNLTVLLTLMATLSFGVMAAPVDSEQLMKQVMEEQRGLALDAIKLQISGVLYDAYHYGREQDSLYFTCEGKKVEDAWAEVTVEDIRSDKFDPLAVINTVARLWEENCLKVNGTAF